MYEVIVTNSGGVILHTGVIKSRHEAACDLGEGLAIWDRLDRGEIAAISRDRAICYGYAVNVVWRKAQ